MVAGCVAAGKGVVAPAQSRHAAREITRLGGGRTFKKHVLQHMGHARRAIDLVNRADPHPQHVRRCGRAAVRFDDHCQPIAKGELLDFLGGLGSYSREK